MITVAISLRYSFCASSIATRLLTRGLSVKTRLILSSYSNVMSSSMVCTIILSAKPCTVKVENAWMSPNSKRTDHHYIYPRECDGIYNIQKQTGELCNHSCSNEASC